MQPGRPFLSNLNVEARPALGAPVLPDQKKKRLGLARLVGQDLTSRPNLLARIWGSLGLKALSSGLLLLLAFVLARLLGAEGYGAYGFGLATLNLIAGIAVVGLDNLLLGQVAVYRSRKSWSFLRGLLRWTLTVGLVVSVTALLLSQGALRFFGQQPGKLYYPTTIVLLALPAIVLIRLRQAVLQGLEHPLLAQFPEAILQPLLLLGLIAFLYLAARKAFSPVGVAALFVVSCGAAFVLGAILLKRAMPEECAGVAPEYERRAWVKTARPLLLVHIMSTVSGQGETLVLGMLKGGRAVGQYIVAQRLALLISFTLYAANVVLPAIMARLHDQKDKASLEKMMVQSSRWMFVTSLPLALLYLVAGRWIVKLFGPDFSESYSILLILLVGQLVNVAAGSVGFLLLMTGRGRKMAVAMATSALVNIGLAAALVPKLGAQGAAWASALSLILWNVWLSVVVIRSLGIFPTLIGPVLRRSK